ncbi:hypothetical protein KR100_10390 [Synechococcus sp. KORDI-100]|nr:hypothetical protein KR100_10390 [Synechococcus sp. KORDI-100]
MHLQIELSHQWRGWAGVNLELAHATTDAFAIPTTTGRCLVIDWMKQERKDMILILVEECHQNN